MALAVAYQVPCSEPKRHRLIGATVDYGAVDPQSFTLRIVSETGDGVNRGCQIHEIEVGWQELQQVLALAAAVSRNKPELFRYG